MPGFRAHEDRSSLAFSARWTALHLFPNPQSDIGEQSQMAPSVLDHNNIYQPVGNSWRRRERGRASVSGHLLKCFNLPPAVSDPSEWTAPRGLSDKGGGRKDLQFGARVGCFPRKGLRAEVEAGEAGCRQKGGCWEPGAGRRMTGRTGQRPARQEKDPSQDWIRPGSRKEQPWSGLRMESGCVKTKRRHSAQGK